MTGIELFWTWVAGFLTLCIFSFLYRDNPFYKFAEHVFVGVSAGYAIAQNYNEVLRKILFDKLWHAGHAMATGQGFDAAGWLYLVPAALGLMLIARLVPSWAWVSRWPLAFIVGMGAGYAIVYTMDASIVEQIQATIVPLWTPQDVQATVRAWILVLGVMTGLLYFYFSKEHKGPIFGTASRIGIWFLMITFGSAFGYTVMARVSLLIGRMTFIMTDWIYGTYHYFNS